MLKVFADGALFAETHGAGRPAVLALHGWARSRADFAAVLGETPALALDLPGFGASPPPPTAMGAAGYAAVVAPVLADMVTPVTIVGHSFGGRVAVQLAADAPDRVGGLVLTGVPLLRRQGPRPQPKRSFRAARWLHRRGLLGDAAMERLRSRHGSADYRASSGVMRDVLVTAVNETYEEQLAAVRCPVELVWGERDDTIPVSVMEAAAEILEAAGAQVRREVVPGAGHLLPIEAPERLAAAVGRSEAWLGR